MRIQHSFFGPTGDQIEAEDRNGHCWIRATGQNEEVVAVLHVTPDQARQIVETLAPYAAPALHPSPPFPIVSPDDPLRAGHLARERKKVEQEVTPWLR